MAICLCLRYFIIYLLLDMKFLCIDCDEPMKIKRTEGPEEGSLTVIFGCPICQRDIALLTNPWETQLLRSMDVKVGGKTVPAEPMSMIRTTLAQKHEENMDKQTVSGSTFETQNRKDLERQTPDSGPGCPFSQMVSHAFARNTSSVNKEPVWTEEAEKRLERIPSFVRPMVKKGVEMYAKERGYNEINEAVMDEAKGRFGM